MSYLVKFRQRKQDAYMAILWCFDYPYLAKIICEFLAVELDVQWRECGDTVCISGDIAELKGPSASALLNQVEISTFNKHRLALKCLKNGSRCRYIGIVDPLKVKSLKENLQYGARGARIALDGGCRRVYEDMVDYTSNRVSRVWEDGSLIEVEVDHLDVVFHIDGHFVYKSRIPNDVAVVSYVVGFGTRSGEKYKAMYYTME